MGFDALHPSFKARCKAGFQGYAEHVRQLEGASPLSNLMEVKDSEAQGHYREVMSEGSVKQNCEPMNKNRM
ncbi:hypothetical protein MASR1M12_14390 [Erysipelotrichia bacterium]